MEGIGDIVAPWEGEAVTGIVCMNVSELSKPHVDSEKCECSMCKAEVWLAKSSHEVLAKYPETPLYCLRCALTLSEGRKAAYEGEHSTLVVEEGGTTRNENQAED